MRIYVDLALERITVASGIAQQLTSLEFKRSLQSNLEVQFTRAGTVVELPNDATGIFGIKDKGKYDGNYVAAALAWIKSGSGEATFYTFSLNFITTALDLLFKVDGNANNDVAELLLMGELQWQTGGAYFKSQTVEVKLNNDVNRGGEIVSPMPPIAYGVFLPEITGLVGGGPNDLDSVATVPLVTGYIIEVLVEVTGVLTWLTYVLTAGPVTGVAPGQVDPLDYDVVMNNRHWRGAMGPSGPAGVNAGIPYLWNTSTASTDPGAGKVKVNNASLASATELYISETDHLANALAALLATWDDGTSIVRGRILFQDPATPTNFAIFDITGTLTDNGGWDTFTIAHVSSGGTLTNNLPVQLFFIPKGDKGDIGITGTPGGIPYLWNTDTASSDPTTGRLKVNNATLSAATALYISETDNAANVLSAYLATLDDGTSTIRGRLFLTDTVTPANFAIFDISGALTDNGTWDTFTIAHVASGGVFTNNLALRLIFVPKGDKGDTGAGGSTGAAGREAALQYLWNTNAASSDPTAGHLKVNNATLASATALYISETDNDANALAALLATWDDGTSTIRGRIFIHSPAAPTNFVIFNITGTLTDNGTWDTFTIAYVAGGGTLTNDMPVTVVFTPKGDKGDAGSTDLTQNLQNADYTLALSDAGKHIFHDEVTARTYTIPANGSVAFPVGTTITIANNNGAGAITLAITTDTLRRGDGTAGTGSRTIPADAIATILKTKTTEWMVVGVFT